MRAALGANSQPLLLGKEPVSAFLDARIRAYLSALSAKHMPLPTAFASLVGGEPLYPGFA